MPLLDRTVTSDPAAIPSDIKTSPAGAQALDLRGLRCPMPVLRTRKALNALRSGNFLWVICTDPLAGLDLPHLLSETGDALVRTRQDGTTLAFLIRKA